MQRAGAISSGLPGAERLLLSCPHSAPASTSSPFLRHRPIHTHLTPFGAFKKMITVNERKMLWEKSLLSAFKSTEHYLEPDVMRSMYVKIPDCPWDRN